MRLSLLLLLLTALIPQAHCRLKSIKEFFRSDTNVDPTDECTNNRNYVVQKNADEMVLETKRIQQANCLKVSAYHNENFELRFYYANDYGNYTEIQFDPKHPQNATISGIAMQVHQFDSHLVYTDKNTGQSTLYVKTNLTELTFTVPFEYNYMWLARNKHTDLEMWLDTNPPSNSMQTFYFTDYIVLLIELANIMVLVDLGLIFVLIFRRYNLDHSVHSKIMWLVLIMELLSLFYFLWRYQFYFWHVTVFFCFFISSLSINIFTIGNASLGVFLMTAIFERHICQNIPVIKSVHRIFGYASYVLMKVNVIFKLIIFYYVCELVPDIVLLAIIAANPLIWIFYFTAKFTRFYNA